MKLERIQFETNANAYSRTADKIAREEKHTENSDAVKFDSERRRQNEQPQKEGKEKADNHAAADPSVTPPVATAAQSSDVKPSIDVRV